MLKCSKGISILIDLFSTPDLKLFKKRRFYFKGSILAYANEIKTEILNVDGEKIDKYGAVSEEVVTEMAINVRKLMHTDYGLSTSGIAGPDGGTKEKPVGTIWLALASKNEVFAKKIQLGYNREINIQVAATYALNMLRKELQKNI